MKHYFILLPLSEIINANKILSDNGFGPENFRNFPVYIKGRQEFCLVGFQEEYIGILNILEKSNVNFEVNDIDIRDSSWRKDILKVFNVEVKETVKNRI